MNDTVEHPAHYTQGGIECIEAIKSALSNITDPFEAYCTGNIIKYIWRWNDKNGIEDLHKAIQYIDFIEQYRAKITTASDDLDMGEEDVSEPEPTKPDYSTMTNRKLRYEVCATATECEYGKCPLVIIKDGVTMTCTPFSEQYPELFREVAIGVLEENNAKK